jgi:hypothetical protein
MGGSLCHQLLAKTREIEKNPRRTLLCIGCDGVFAVLGYAFDLGYGGPGLLSWQKLLLMPIQNKIVPEDNIRDVACKMHIYPEVGVIQDNSDVRQGTHMHFENAITHFTYHINRTIPFRCDNEEVTVLIGTNVFLR